MTDPVTHLTDAVEAVAGTLKRIGDARVGFREPTDDLLDVYRSEARAAIDALIDSLSEADLDRIKAEKRARNA